jgi:hypothetical protein
MFSGRTPADVGARTVSASRARHAPGGPGRRPRRPSTGLFCRAASASSMLPGESLHLVGPSLSPVTKYRLSPHGPEYRPRYRRGIPDGASPSEPPPAGHPQATTFPRPVTCCRLPTR